MDRNLLDEQGIINPEYLPPIDGSSHNHDASYYTKTETDAKLFGKVDSVAVQTALDTKVDKITGKGLSTNDYTDAEKTKLSGIEAGAQVNAVTSVQGKTGAVTLKIPKAQRFIIGTVRSGHTAEDVDYLCQGVSDNLTINAAISSIGLSGGIIIFREGTYNISEPVILSKDDITFDGSAAIFDKTFPGTTSDPLIKITADRCKVSGFRLNGRKDTYSVASPLISIVGKDCTVDNNTCQNSYGSGIEIRGENARVINNRCVDNRVDGIQVPYDGGSGLIRGNICNNNTNYGINLGHYKPCTVTGNICNGNKAGVYVGSASNHIIVDNHLMDNSQYGIHIYGNNCIVSGNRCYRGSGYGSDYTSSQYTIYAVNCNKCLFTNNLLLGKNYVVNGPSDGTIFNNNIY